MDRALPAGVSPGTRFPWPLPAALAVAAVLALIGLFHQTAWSMVETWKHSETYAHGFIIAPISAWMIWRRRDLVASQSPRPEWLPLPLLAVVGFGWLLADLAGVQVVAQYAFVTMIPLLVWAVLGRAVLWSMAFPLAYLLLAVPVGEVFIPPLIELTANFTVTGLNLSGVPVYREGNYLSLATGNWSVVEACSGLRYLIASFTLGCLYAYLTYTRAWKRAVFILASLAIPIVANGIRAYMIVMLGHLSDMRLAVGVDHLIYGWVFFGLVMMFMFWGGGFWRDPEPAASPAGDASTAPAAGSSGRIAARAAAAIAVCAAWPAYAALVESRPLPPGPERLEWRGDPAWAASPDLPQGWKPHYLGQRAELARAFSRDGARVGVYIAYYRGQRQGSELISWQNVLVPEKDERWALFQTGSVEAVLPGGPERMRESRLRGLGPRLMVWHWDWVAGRHTSNLYLEKALLARSKLLDQGDDAAAIFVFAPYTERPEEAEAVLRRFLAEQFSAIDATLTSAR